MLSIAPFGGPVTVEVAGQRHAIGLPAAEKVFVVDVSPATERQEAAQ